MDKTLNKTVSRSTDAGGDPDAPRLCPDATGTSTAIERCVQNEMKRYFSLLEGQAPADLYRLVMRQAEGALIRAVLSECKGNQSRAAAWLGISRGTLRCKLAEQSGTSS